MNVLSLFDGMSCGRIALERAEIPVTNYYASEIDKYAIKVSKANYPDIIQIGDVRNVKASDLPKIDLLIGGSPCQGFSFAGKGLNFDDPRSKLFFEYVRLLNECKPKWFLLENVNMKQEWQNVISEKLNIQPYHINSDLVSAQTRNRLYWTNISEIMQPVDRGIYWCDVFEENADAFYYSDQSFNWIFKSDKRKQKYKEYQRDENIKMQMIEASHYKGYSNQRCFGIRDNKGIRYISPIECERLQTVPDNYTSSVSNTQRYKMLGNGWTVDVIAHIFKHISLC